MKKSGPFGNGYAGPSLRAAPQPNRPVSRLLHAKPGQNDTTVGGPPYRIVRLPNCGGPRPIRHGTPTDVSTDLRTCRAADQQNSTERRGTRHEVRHETKPSIELADKSTRAGRPAEYTEPARRIRALSAFLKKRPCVSAPPSDQDEDKAMRQCPPKST